VDRIQSPWISTENNDDHRTVLVDYRHRTLAFRHRRRRSRRRPSFVASWVRPSPFNRPSIDPRTSADPFLAEASVVGQFSFVTRRSSKTLLGISRRLFLLARKQARSANPSTGVSIEIPAKNIAANDRENLLSPTGRQFPGHNRRHPTAPFLVQKINKPRRRKYRNQTSPSSSSFANSLVERPGPQKEVKR